jgi:hypothetical protein
MPDKSREARLRETSAASGKEVLYYRELPDNNKKKPKEKEKELAHEADEVND